MRQTKEQTIAVFFFFITDAVDCMFKILKGNITRNHRYVIMLRTYSFGYLVYMKTFGLHNHNSYSANI